MAASSSDWNEAVAYWSRVGELGMEGALREAGCSEQTIVETLSLVNSSRDFNLAKLKSLTDPELGRATVLATLARDSSHIQEIDARWTKWTMGLNEAAALCVNLSSNRNISALYLFEHDVFGKVEGCELLGNALATNSALRTLVLIYSGMGSDGVRCLLHGLQSNKTLDSLNLGGNPLQDEGVSCVADFMIKNSTIKDLNLHGTDSSIEGPKHMALALVSNTTLEALCLGVKHVGRDGMKTLLEPLSLDVGVDAVNSSSSPKNTSLKSLILFDISPECQEAVSHMIRTNKFLSTLQLRYRPALPTDWNQKIFPALNENHTLESINFDGSDGLNGEEVYESLTDLLRNTKLEVIGLTRTGLESRQRQINEELRINREFRSRLTGTHRR